MRSVSVTESCSQAPLAAMVMAPKLSMTPLGTPVLPEVYTMVARSSGLGLCTSARGSVRPTMASQVSPSALAGARGSTMRGMSAGMPGAMAS